MPYIVTTTPGDVREAEIRLGGRLTAIMGGSEPATPDSEQATHDALAEVERRKSRRAVATLEDDLDADGRKVDGAWTTVARITAPTKPFQRHDERMAAAVEQATREITASGGTITLPDGTVIEVEQQPDDFDVAAYNATQEGAMT